MKVYELIQELAQYAADTEVKFHINADFTTDVGAEFDRENADSVVQQVTVDANFDEYVDFSNIVDRGSKVAYRDIVIHLTYKD